MELRIDSEIFRRFPGLRLGVVVAWNIQNRNPSGGMQALLMEAGRRAASRCGEQPLTKHPRIAAWREAYRRFGASPRRCRCSIESLLRRVRKGDVIRSVNPVVDLYNLVSLDFLLPAGAEDLDRIKGDVELTFAGPDEAPVRLLGDPRPRPPHPGEVIYRDRKGAICRRWNWKEAHRTRLREDTRRALLILEALPPAGTLELQAASTRLARLLFRLCGASVRTRLLDHEHPRTSLQTRSESASAANIDTKRQ